MSTAPVQLPIADARSSWREARRLLRHRRGTLAATTSLLLLGSAAALAIPPLLGWIVDLVIDEAPMSQLMLAAGLVIAAGILSALLLRWGGLLLVSALQGALAELREEVFSAAIRLDRGEVEAVGTSDVVSRVTGDVEAITEAVSEVLPRFVQAGFTILLTVVGLLVLDPLLAAAALVAVPVQLVSTLLFLRRSRPLYRRLRREESERGQAIIEAVRGADTVIAHGHQDHHLGRIARRSLRAVETGISAARARNRFNAGLNAAEYLGLAAILAVGFLRVADDAVTVGAVTAAALFVHRLFGPIGALLSSIDDLQRAAAGLGRLTGVLHIRRAPLLRREISGSAVRIHDLSHRYGDDAPPALQDIGLHLSAGSTTVLVGVSGSGKSTLALMIAGGLRPDAGEVLIGGVPAAEAGRHGAPAALLVSQEGHAFSGSLSDNLRAAAPLADDDALREALRTVRADWAQGSDVDLDDPLPRDIPAGHLQQLALARVLLADPPVVVLDEATAHAGDDPRLDAGVRAVIAGRTAVIVAHRLAQAESADRIVVLDHGRIVEQGDPRDLAHRPGGAYARLRAAAGNPGIASPEGTHGQ